jgi:hypothetical protein
LKVPHVLDWPLVCGVVPAVLTGLGVLASGVLLARRRRAWWVRVLPAAAGATVVLCQLIAAVNALWLPSRGSLRWHVVGWGRVPVFAVAWL